MLCYAELALPRGSRVGSFLSELGLPGSAASRYTHRCVRGIIGASIVTPNSTAPRNPTEKKRKMSRLGRVPYQWVPSVVWWNQAIHVPGGSNTLQVELSLSW